MGTTIAKTTAFIMDKNTHYNSLMEISLFHGLLSYYKKTIESVTLYKEVRQIGKQNY
jgi:hypothetical protein